MAERSGALRENEDLLAASNQLAGIVAAGDTPRQAGSYASMAIDGNCYYGSRVGRKEGLNDEETIRYGMRADYADDE